MQKTMLLALLCAACTTDPPAVVVNGESCEAFTLAVLDPAVLPGWTVHAMLADTIEGDAVWTLASDPEGAVQVKPWPQGPALAINGFAGPDDYQLLRGRVEGESWLLLDSLEQMRVWRLGAAARGEVRASNQVERFAEHGRWTYHLLLVGDAPYMLAVSTGMPARDLRFQLAPLDPDSLQLGDAGPLQWFTELCEPSDADPCTLIKSNTTLAEVQALAVSEFGRMPGAAAMFGLSFRPEDSMSPAFVTLQAIDRGPAGPPELVARVVGLVAAKNSSQQRGRLASDGAGLYVSALVAGAGGKIEHADFGHAYTPLRERSSGAGWSSWAQAGPLLQLGDYVILGDLVDDRWEFVRVEHGKITSTVATTDLVLPMQTQMWSAGHEQLLIRPPTGPAMRVGARCADL